MSCESRGVKVDHACSGPNSCPIVTSFGFENRPLRLSSLECGGRQWSLVGATDQHRPRVGGNDLYGRLWIRRSVRIGDI